MGRAASHITLECALQTHPNITLIGEEVLTHLQLHHITYLVAQLLCNIKNNLHSYQILHFKDFQISLGFSLDRWENDNSAYRDSPRQLDKNLVS